MIRTTIGIAGAALAALVLLAPPSARAAPGACPVELSGIALRCGTFTVPERRDADGEPATVKRIVLSYAILPARAAKPATDPIVFLTGGPGSSAFLFLQTLADSRLRDEREIVAIEQRGNGYSSPNLVCPERGTAIEKACLARLIGRGVDLAGYDVTESARDIETLRGALDIKQWNVAGVSAGTFWALHYARLFPGGVRSMILDSPVPAQAGIEDEGIARLNGLSRVFAACDASTVCSLQYPDLRTRFIAAVERLTANPRRIGGETIDGARLATMAVGLTFESATVPFVPRFVDAVDKDDWATAMKIAALNPYRLPRRFDPARMFALGLNINLNCRDEAPFPAAAEARLKLDEAWPASLTRPLLDEKPSDLTAVCRDVWKVAKSDPVVNAPVRSSIPTLILAGGFDPATPPEWGQVMAKTLDNATLAIVPDAAHAVLSWPSACVEGLATAFVDAPARTPDTSCLRRPRPTLFKRPADAIELVRVAPRIDAKALQRAIDKLPGLGRTTPGVMLTVTSRSGTASFAAGRRAIGGRDPMRPSDTFRIASVTKTFVAAAALRLVEAQKLDLDGPIARAAGPGTVAALRGRGYDPDRITLRHLLSHTSGLPDYATSDVFTKAASADPARRWTRAEQIAIALTLRGPIPPDERFEYSDTGFVIVGEMIERATNRRLGDAVADLVGFSRLGLSATRWEYSAGDRAIARTYVGLNDLSNWDPSYDLFGGGGLVSTTRDVATFYRAVFEGRVFQRRGSLAAMTTIKKGPAPEDGSIYALGLTVLNFAGEVCWMHPGFSGIIAAYCPRADISFNVTTNSDSRAGLGNLFKTLNATAAALTPR